MSDFLGQGSYTRQTEGGRGGRDPSFPRFHMEPVQDHAASASAGRPIFTEQERVQIIMPGNPNAPVEMVNDGHRQRWPDQYRAFKEGQSHSVSGTPLEQWPVLTRGMVLELKAMEIHTVEQCAGLSDLAIQKIGLGGRRIMELAKAYLDDAEASRLTTEAVARAEKAESLISDLTRQRDEMRAMMDQMHTELMRLRNAPHPVATYVPGDHDPMQPHTVPNAMMVHQAPMPSSLEGLPSPARRGRPPGSRNATAEGAAA